MKVKYVKCGSCSYVYSDELKICPKCKEPFKEKLQEDLDSNVIELIFNLCE